MIKKLELYKRHNRKAQQEEHEKIKEYGKSINEETRNKNK